MYAKFNFDTKLFFDVRTKYRISYILPTNIIRNFNSFELLIAMLNAIDDQDEDEEFWVLIKGVLYPNSNIVPLLATSLFMEIPRDGAFHRLRWSPYLRELAEKENSFVAEYRLSPHAFDRLVEMLDPTLMSNQTMAALAMSKSGSAPISTSSRVGAALIMLAGGRAIESMRTHGLARTTVYENFRSVIRAINNHPALEITCDNSPAALNRRSTEFKELGDHGLFQHCVGAIDGLAIQIEAPKNTRNQ